jgi:hypothetical protein
MSTSNRYSYALIVILIITSGILSILRMNTFQVGAWVDDAHYEVMAEGFASGLGPRLINFPDKPIEGNFSFGWALMLSPFAVLFPGNYDAMKVLSLIFWLACIPLAYRLLHPRLKSPYTELVIALIALNPAPIGHAGMLMAEPAYIFFSLLGLLLFERWWNKTDRKISWLLVAIALCAVISWQLRAVGLALMAALPAYLLLSRRFRAAAVAILIIGGSFGLQAWFNSQTNRAIVYDLYDSPTFGQFAESGFSLQTKIEQMLQNAYDYSNEMIATLLIPVFGNGMNSFFGRFGLGFIPGILNLVILALILGGFLLSLREFRLSEIYLIFYAGALLTYWWNFEDNGAYARFLIPLLPFLWLYLFQSVLWIMKRLPVAIQKFELVALVTVVVAICGVLVVRNISAWNDPTRNYITDLSIGTSWAKENTPADSIIMTADPISRFLYARRSTVDFPPPDQDLEQFIEANGVDYVLLAPTIAYGDPRPNVWVEYATSTVLPYIEANPEGFELVFSDESQNVQLYRVLPAAAS